VTARIAFATLTDMTSESPPSPPDPGQNPYPYGPPGQQPTQPLGIPPQPPAGKSRKPLLIIGIVVGALVLLCCGIGVVVSAVSPKVKPKAGPSPTAVATTTPTAVPATTPAAPPPTTQAAPPPPPPTPGPKTLLTLKGNGIKKSAIFTTSDEWSLAYTFDCSSFGSQGNFAVSENDAQGNPQDVLVNQLPKKGSDNVPVHADPGQHYLDMNSECSWTITVTG